MKALDILKIQLQAIEAWGFKSDDLDNQILETKEAIAELEALQAPKTCDGCRNIGKLMDICCDCSRMWSDKFEPKGSE